MTITDSDIKRLQKRIRRRGPRVSYIRILYKTVPIRKAGSTAITYKTKVCMV